MASSSKLIFRQMSSSNSKLAWSIATNIVCNTVYEMKIVHSQVAYFTTFRFRCAGFDPLCTRKIRIFPTSDGFTLRQYNQPANLGFSTRSSMTVKVGLLAVGVALWDLIRLCHSRNMSRN